MTPPTPKKPEVIALLFAAASRAAEQQREMYLHVSPEKWVTKRLDLLALAEAVGELNTAYDALKAERDEARAERDAAVRERDRYKQAGLSAMNILRRALSAEGPQILEGLALQAETRLAAVEQHTRNMTNALGFFASCIKSGEAWSGECEKMLRAAYAALTPTRHAAGGEGYHTAKQVFKAHGVNTDTPTGGPQG
jgi:hypothetical protein